MVEPSKKKNTIYNALKTLSSIVFPLITFPYVSRVLQPENIGKINFGNSVVSYFSLLATLGVTVYAVRECSRVRDNREQLGHVASQIMSINLCTTVLAYILLGITLMCAESLRGYEILILIQAVSIFFNVIGADWLNTAMEDFRYITVRTFMCQLIALIAMFAFVHSPNHYIIYAIIGVLSSSGANLANVFYRRKFAKIRFTLDMDWRKHLPPILWLFAMMISQSILGNLDITMLGVMRGDVEVGLYTTASKCINILGQVVLSVAWVVMPQLSYLFAQKDYAKINPLLHKTLIFTVGLGFPCLAFANALAYEIIMIVGGAGYLGALTCMHILTIATLITFINGFYGNIILLPSQREKQFMFACILSAVGNAALNFIVIPRYGIEGASISTVLASTIILAVCMYGIEPEIRLGSRRKIYLAPVLGSILILFVGWGVRILIDGFVLRIVLVILIGSSAYLFLLWIMQHEFVLSVINTISRRLFNNK